MGARHSQNNYEFKSSNNRGDKGQKKKKRVGDRDDMQQNTSSFSTRIPKIHQGMPSPLFPPKASKGNGKQEEELDKERAAAELGTVFAVCFPGCG